MGNLHGISAFSTKEVLNMPKFRITTKDSRGTGRRSIDFPNKAAASHDAQRALVDMASDELPNGKRAEFAVKVEDGKGKEIYSGSLKYRGHSGKAFLESKRRGKPERQD